ncbi:phenylalanine--tRNA ligase [Maritalea myrionectae]|uniref:Phenylalanine--tRNA ligase beta subunit n=1 Tax=Maritalea myrionectae TaxID=454601 RepID=A0A2R4MIK0_9HYPH|nr:phenylalanine--tRNA ligase subunit beta [Maritalea myrionectae]AVX05845.1 phenylalanine--tRNA ligase [Maritalea myrionectae]
MKFTIDWLKDHLDTTASNDEIIETLTQIGLEVEEVEDQAKALADFTVCEVLSAEKHPNADKLKVCMVSTGKGDPVKVVCGAPNARTGMKGVFAASGTYIPGTDFVLSKGVIRGEESNGMLCSERELLLSDDHDGVIDLPADAPVGERYVDYAKLNDVVIDIAITPNRGDCTGIYGVARDLAAVGVGELKDGTVQPVPATLDGKGDISVEFRFGEGEPQACQQFAGRLFKNVKNGASPEWMQQRLIAIGLRPINALADITNYVSYDRGRPLHAYDADKINGQFHARNAKKGEEILALDGKTYQLDETMCILADDNGPLCIGGIMGGEESGCTEDTTSLFLESAWWEPIEIAQTGRKTGINSDARYRLERHVDPELTIAGLELATKLILEICGGEVHEITVTGDVQPEEKVIDFPLAEITRLTGLKVPFVEVKAVLSRLGFWVAGSGDVVKVAVPSYRPDIEGKADLVEEVMRIVGVDNVPVDPLPRLTSVAPKMLTTIQNRRRIARRALAARGFNEAVTWSFVSEKEATAFGGGQDELKLENPISAELSDMRPSLLPGLLAAVNRNTNRGIANLSLFEVGQVFKTAAPDGQYNYAAGVRAGLDTYGQVGRHWQGKAEKPDVFEAKADLFETLAQLGVDPNNLQIVAEPATWSHPGRGGRVQLGPKNIIGWFGELHPKLIKDLDLPKNIAAFELNLDAIPQPRAKATKAKPALTISDLQTVKRDFAFVADQSVEAGKLLKAAGSADKKLITNVSLFDVFEGSNLGEGKKSLAIEVTIQPKDKTLTDEEIDAISQKVVAAVQKATKAELRG